MSIETRHTSKTAAPMPEHWKGWFAAFDSLWPAVNPRIATRRAVAREKLDGVGLPTLRNEEWKYTSPRAVISEKWTSAESGQSAVTTRLPLLTEGAGPRIVFVGGHWSTKLTSLKGLPEGVEILPLSEAFDKFPEKVEKLLTQRQREQAGLPQPLAKVGTEATAFQVLADALTGPGVWIHIPRNTDVRETINIMVSAGDVALQAQPIRVIIDLEESASATVLETWTGEKAKTFSLATTDLFVGANASLNWSRIQAEAPEAVHVGLVRASAGRNARLSTFCLFDGAQLSRTNLEIFVTGEGAEVSAHGFYRARSSQIVDFHSAIDHRVPHTTSNQLYKGILSDSSRAVFNGKIFVRKDAQQTAAFQTNKNLVLGDKAEIDTKPQLEIEADDVKCSHGATVGQLNENELFYMLSRGIKPGVAQSLLCEAFATDAMACAPAGEIREKMLSVVRSSAGAS